MANFSRDEMNLMCIYNTGKRTGLIAELYSMSKYLTNEDSELRSLTMTVIKKLNDMSDADYEKLELYPDFDE